MNIDINLKFFSFTRKISINRQWFQLGIIAVVILIVMIAAYWGSMKTMVFISVFPLCIVGLYFFIRQPNLIYILILLGGMFVPFAGPGGFNASVLLIILLVFLWIMDMFVVKRQFWFVYSRPIRPILYFLATSVVAFAVGQISWFSFASQAPLKTQLGGFAIYFLLPLTTFITPNLIKDMYWLKVVFWTFIGLSMVYVTGRALGLSFADRIYQHGYIANSMLWTWLVSLIFSQVIYNHELKWRPRALLIIFVIVIFYVDISQNYDWKSGWVPAVVAAAALVGLRFKKLAVFAIPFVFAVGVYLASDLIAGEAWSWGTRLDAWIVVLNISSVSPLVGVGFANYYWYARVFSIRGYSISFNSHSQFIDLIAQTGILGLLCFFWILFEVSRLAWDLSQRLNDGFARGYAYGVLVGVLGSLMAAFLVDWVLPFAYNIGLDGVRASILPWIFFGGLISIEQIYFSKSKPGSLNIHEQSLR